MLLVIGNVGAIDLYPFPRACHATGLKRDDVISGELQFGRGGRRQAQSDTLGVITDNMATKDDIKALDSNTNINTYQTVASLTTTRC